jgi:hypothetical protein
MLRNPGMQGSSCLNPEGVALIGRPFVRTAPLGLNRMGCARFTFPGLRDVRSSRRSTLGYHRNDPLGLKRPALIMSAGLRLLIVVTATKLSVVSSRLRLHLGFAGEKSKPAVFLIHGFFVVAGSGKLAGQRDD